MAFRKNEGTGNVTLTFGDDTDYPGLTVVIRKMTVNAWLETLNTAEQVTDNGRRIPMNGLLHGIRIAADHLVSWDLEEADGTPVPVSAALDQDKDLMTEIYAGWLNGSVGVSAPLEQNSPDGPPLVRDVPLPMEG